MAKKKKKPVLHPPVLFVGSYVDAGSVVRHAGETADDVFVPGCVVEPYVSITRMNEFLKANGQKPIRVVDEE